jgi:hypothetical protein
MTTARYESGNAVEEEDPLVVADAVVAVEAGVLVVVEDELWACTVESWKVPELPLLFPSPE